jgi:hypothetical protein
VVLVRDQSAKIQYAQQLHLAAAAVAAADIKIPAHYLAALAAAVTMVTSTMQARQAQIIKVMLAVQAVVHRNQLVAAAAVLELLVNKIRLAVAMAVLV